MSLFSFYREATPEPPPALAEADVSHEDDEDTPLPTAVPTTTSEELSFYGTPQIDPSDEDFSPTPDSTSTFDPFEFARYESQSISITSPHILSKKASIEISATELKPRLEEVTVPEESLPEKILALEPPGHRASEATTVYLSAGSMALPVELWSYIFNFVAPDTDDDSFHSVDDLLSCARCCRAWSMIALPMLYRTHGYGVFMPKPATRDASAAYFPISRSIDFFTTSVNKRMLQLWRTLLLSCFTASRPNLESRFTTFAGATLFPYISYVQYLDTRTLIMVLSAIMKSQSPTERDSSPSLDPSAAEYFFAGALGAFEISGQVRGEKMVVGGPEYRVQSPVGGKEVKIFVGDTALMIMDFLYPHLYHLQGFTIPELGQLRVHSAITMQHPGTLLSSLRNLNTLVISSGWMVSAGLGKAIASIRPSLPNRGISPTFRLSILDWRFKTHHDPHYHQDEDWEANKEDYRYTVRSAVDFFNALNPNSITNLDLDFEVHHNFNYLGDVGEGAVAIRQSRSLKALRIAHLRCTEQRLNDMFRRLSIAGFAPKYLRLEDLYSNSTITGEKWNFTNGMFDNLEHLEIARFAGIFHLAVGIIRRQPGSEDTFRYDMDPSRMAAPIPLKTLKLSYNETHFQPLAAEALILNTIPALGSSLTSLTLVDTDHGLSSPIPPRRRTRYDGLFNYNQHLESPLESLTNLRNLVLSGDVAAFLIAGRLPHIIRALNATLESCDICISVFDLTEGLEVFLECPHLHRLFLRNWNWDAHSRLTMPVAGARLTVQTVKSFLDRCRAVQTPGGCRRLIMNDLLIGGGLLEVAGHQSWGKLKRWAVGIGCRFRWNMLD